MSEGKKVKGKKVTLALTIVKKQEAKKVVNPLFETRHCAGHPAQKRSHTLPQMQRDVLCKQLSISPAINQFPPALDQQTATQLLMLAHSYRPEKSRRSIKVC